MVFSGRDCDIICAYVTEAERSCLDRDVTRVSGHSTQGVSRTPIKDTIPFLDVKWVGKSNSEVRLRTASLGEKLEPDY